MARSAIVARHNVVKERTIVDFERQDNDWYVEPRWVVEQLIDAVPFSGTVHDPCCGMGTIPETFRSRGFDTSASDIVARGYGTVENLFLATRMHDNMVFNPPYKVAEDFIAAALVRTRATVAAIVNIKFLASQGRRDRLFKSSPPTAVLICSRRPSMPPGGQGIEAKGGTADYCWIVWDKFSHIPTRLGWL